MPILTSSRLVSQIQRMTKESFYADTALLLIDVDSGTVDEFNNPVITTTKVPIDCSYHELSSKEQWRGYGDIGIVEGEIRFANPKPTKGNRVEITSRYGGEPLPGVTLEIVSIDNRSTMGFLCALKRISL
jgi:hypothetical protein